MGTLVTWQEFAASELKGGTIREIVLSEVIDTVARDRPFMALLSNGSAEGLFIERLEDTIGSRGVNAVVEGASHTAPDLTTPSRLGFHVQRFAEWGQVSDEQRDTSHYTTEDMFLYQAGKSMDEMLNDIEHALCRGTVVSGATNTARQLEGLLNVANVSGTLTFVTDASGTTFTEAQFISRLQAWPDNDLEVRPTVALVNSWLKRTISEFSTKITRNVDASGVRQILLIERHSSDFGDVDIIYSRDQLKSSGPTNAGNSFVVFDPNLLEKGWFKMPTLETLAREGFYDRYQMTAMLTLIYKTRKAVGGGVGYVPNITLS